MGLYVAIMLIHLTGPDGQVIEINPSEIVSVRVPRSSDHFASGTHCLIHTTDGKVITVREKCSEVKALVEK